jgi:hypothetical protein
MKRVRINLLAATVVLFGAANLASAAPAAHDAPFGECEDLEEVKEDARKICPSGHGDVTITCIIHPDGEPEIRVEVNCH